MKSEKVQTLQSKRHYKKAGTQKALNFAMGINITPPNYLFNPKIVLKYYFAPS